MRFSPSSMVGSRKGGDRNNPQDVIVSVFVGLLIRLVVWLLKAVYNGLR
jgi:hypothetical protein